MRKIIHVDMDCFYAAIEIRDNPALQNKAVAVGGDSEKRGVLCTCNYIARQYGLHSAMPTATAYRLCPDLILLPVNMPKYRQVSKTILSIFRELTSQIEPLSLDEAYLDVSDNPAHNNSATWMAQALRENIWQKERLTASAGVAPNKLLAKIASSWNKPNGLCVIPPSKVKIFMETLPVHKLLGVGQVRAQQFKHLGINTCGDLQQLPLRFLIRHFGKAGLELYYQAQGIDERPVETQRMRKSISVETTLAKDILGLEACAKVMAQLYLRLLKRIEESTPQRAIKNQFIKIKFSNFKVLSREQACRHLSIESYLSLLKTVYDGSKTLRLLGLGISFFPESSHSKADGQLSLFSEADLELSSR